MEHARLSASSSSRWINCPASIDLTDLLRDDGRIPQDTSSPAAAEGTKAHDCAEKALNGKPFDADPEMRDYVNQYVEYVHAQPGFQNYDLHVEVRVDTSDYIPDGFGTADAIMITGDTMHVVDLKYGVGVKVYAADNTQMMIYALGAIKTLGADVKNVVLHIAQPRLNHFDVFHISMVDLLRWGKTVLLDSVRKIQGQTGGTLVFNPSDDACRWCPVNEYCPALRKQAIAMLPTHDVMSLTDVELVTNDELAEHLANIPLIKQWISAMEKRGQEELKRGATVPGFKLVEGRRTRRWRDDEEAANVLAVHVDPDQLYERKLLSPTKVQKIIGKKRMIDLIELIEKPPGKPTVALEDDPRVSISINMDLLK